MYYVVLQIAVLQMSCVVDVLCCASDCSIVDVLCCASDCCIADELYVDVCLLRTSSRGR